MRPTLTILLALAACAASAGTARADAYNPSCGTNPEKYATAYSLARSSNSVGGVWTVRWDQNCGVGGTVEYKIQSRLSSIDDWADQSDSLYRTTPGQANKESVIVASVNGDCDPASAWRVVVTDANGASTAYLNPRSGAGC